MQRSSIICLWLFAAMTVSLTLSGTRLLAQENDSTKNRKISVLPVPAFGYEPETGAYIGAVALFTLDLYQDSLTRTSNAKAEFNYTWRKQMILETGWTYFFRNETWFTEGLLHYSNYPDLYYGIGSECETCPETSFESRRTIVNVKLLRKLQSHFFTGLSINFQHYYQLRDSLDTEFYPELTNARTAGAGVILLYDNRQNLLNPQQGKYLRLDVSQNYFDGTAYQKVQADLRIYHTFFKKLTLAIRQLNEWTAGDPPFYDYALMGGDEQSRGYFYGRFRDKNLSSLQAEVRFPVYGRFGLAFFGGLTTLYPNANNFELNGLKPNAGGGLRFVIDRKENINLRLDYAVGKNNQSGFYIAFGESF